MEQTVKNQLRRLVGSLTKPEKRNFRLYVHRLESNEDRKFVQLFDLLDRQPDISDETLLATLADGQPGKLSNLKRHLYQQLLISLRLIHINKQVDIDVRQQLDFSRILYGKGHVMDALRMLDKAKVKARKNNLDFLLSEILEFQKLIEARHVTRSRQVKNKMDLLVEESRIRAEMNLHTSLQSNVNIQIQGYYILNGHVRTDVQNEHFQQFWSANRQRYEDYPDTEATFFETANGYQASMWRYYILLQLEEALEAALNCYNRFKIETEMPLRDPDFFIRNLYYVNAFAYLLNDAEQADRYTRRMTTFIEERGKGFNDNTHNIAFVYQQLCRLNVHLTRRDWAAAAELMEQLKQDPGFILGQLPAHRRNLFRYKFAATQFARGQFAAALEELQNILNSEATLLREDLLINTRLLQIMAYLETDEFYLADYAIVNLSRVIRRNIYAGKLHHLTLATLRKMVKEDKSAWPALKKELKKEILLVAREPYEAKCLRFLDVVYWLDMEDNGRLA